MYSNQIHIKQLKGEAQEFDPNTSPQQNDLKLTHYLVHQHDTL